MKHRFSRLPTFLATFAFLWAPSLPGAEKYKVDVSHSIIQFKVVHLGVSYAYGRFNDFSGEIVFDPQTPENSSIQLTVNLESVDTNNEERDKHLRGPDFFNVKEFPSGAFKSTAIAKKDGKTYEVTGDFTLNGVTQPVSVTWREVGSGKDPWGGFRRGGEAVLKFKRSDYGIKYMLDGVSDEVELTIALEGVKQD